MTFVGDTQIQSLVDAQVFGARGEWEKHEIGGQATFVKPISTRDVEMKARIASRFDELGFSLIILKFRTGLIQLLLGDGAAIAFLQRGQPPQFTFGESGGDFVLSPAGFEGGNLRGPPAFEQVVTLGLRLCQLLFSFLLSRRFRCALQREKRLSILHRVPAFYVQ